MWKIKGFTLGFTLIEIFVSVGLLAVLSAGVINIIGNGPQKTTRDAKRESDLQQVASALVLYRSDNGTYPGCAAAAARCQVTTYGTYLTTAPTDPTAGRQYFYAPAPSGCLATPASRCTSYTLCASKEASGLATVTCGGASTCGTGTCNLRVQSP